MNSESPNCTPSLFLSLSLSRFLRDFLVLFYWRWLEVQEKSFYNFHINIISNVDGLNCGQLWVAIKIGCGELPKCRRFIDLTPMYNSDMHILVQPTGNLQIIDHMLTLRKFCIFQNVATFPDEQRVNGEQGVGRRHSKQQRPADPVKHAKVGPQGPRRLFQRTRSVTALGFSIFFMITKYHTIPY